MCFQPSSGTGRPEAEGLWLFTDMVNAKVGDSGNGLTHVQQLIQTRPAYKCTFLAGRPLATNF